MTQVSRIVLMAMGISAYENAVQKQDHLVGLQGRSAGRNLMGQRDLRIREGSDKLLV